MNLTQIHFMFEKMKLFLTFIYDIIKHFKNEDRKLKKCFWVSFFHLSFVTIIGTLTAPIIWSIYYLRRYKIFNKLKVPIEDYDGCIPLNRAKVYLPWYDFILFLYGDKADPLCKQLPDWFEEKHKNKSKFIKWFLFSAIRNTMFNYRYKYLITEYSILSSEPVRVIIDTRTDEIVKSNGISNSRRGKYLVIRKDNRGNPYYFYENTSKKYLFYCGYCGLDTLYGHQIFYPRLEMSIRRIS